MGILDYLTEESGFLHEKDGTWYWMTDSYPAQDVSLERGEPDNVVILDSETEKAIGEIDREWSITSVHEGAIYQVEGETWIVERFDYENRRAYAKRVDSDYFTDAHVDTEVRVLRLEKRESRSREVAPVQDPFVPDALPSLDGDRPPTLAQEGEDYSIWSGEVHVTTVATLYKKIRFYTRENVGAEDINLPPEELDTEAFVLTLSESTASELGLHGGDRGAAWHGVGHLLRRIAPLYLRCKPSDLGISTQVKSPHFKEPTLYLYDRVQGGVGLSLLFFRDSRAILTAAREVLEHCACDSGCPVCVGPPEEVGNRGKETALKILEHLSSGPGPEVVEVTEAEGVEE